MFRHLLDLVVFFLGLAVVCWIGAGYAGSHPLALLVTLLIGAGYLAGALELLRYRRATLSLERGLAELSAAPSSLEAWLQQLDPSLRNPVRQRIEGPRGALPGPALTPYLVGLLVLLGMLGTLLGMMAMLRGTGMALETATDLQAIRDSLAAPVKGLGFAFGTSIAGVATSAMLGLLSALRRRERLRVVQLLDLKTATTLRVHSPVHQREESFKLLQRQTELMPALVEQLQGLMTRIEQQNQSNAERQQAGQEAFHQRTEAAYTQLAGSVQHSLQTSIAASVSAANEALQPVMQSTMAAMARESANLHAGITQAVDRQLLELSSGFQASTATVAEIWNQSLLAQQRANETLGGDLRGALERFNDSFEQRASGLLEGVSQRLDASVATQASLTQAMDRQLQQLSAGFQASTVEVAGIWTQSLAGQQRVNQTLSGDLHAALERFNGSFEQRASGLLEGVSQRLDTSAGSLAKAWTQALAQQQQANETLAARHQETLAAAAAVFEQRAAALLANAAQSLQQLQAALATQDQQRLGAWSDTLAATSAALREDWTQAGAHSAERQQHICEALARAADDIAARGQAHASATISEISRLVEAASEAPKAAAEVIAELRQKLSESMVRDTSMLEERTQLMGTLDTLLAAVNHASSEQRGAIDALVATSADLLDRVGRRFSEHIEAETGRLGNAADQVSVGAVEVASLGEAFAGAVQVFGESNDKLAERLQRIEEVLEKSLVRSDEQLAYYVAQAREVVELSMLAQKQIIEDMQQLSAPRAVAATASA